MLQRILSVCIGYLFGCFLTAELVARKFSGKSASELGETGNPGMANIMASLGFIPGIITLLGDILKCLISMTVSFLLFRKSQQSLPAQLLRRKRKWRRRRQRKEKKCQSIV